MKNYAKKFSEYCETNFELEAAETLIAYKSLSVCILDCIYSLRTKYYSVTVPLVERYASLYMDGNRFNSGDTVGLLLKHIEDQGGPKKFAENVLKNHQKLGGKADIAKEDVCYQLAHFLKLLNVDTIDDFQHFESQELLEVVIRSVKGMGDAGTNYLFMLAGDPNRCKPDVHIHRCVRNVCGIDLSNEECQDLFSETVELLNIKYPQLTARRLDSIIWEHYQNHLNKY